jgi:iron complex outermembrane receptor protein
MKPYRTYLLCCATALALPSVAQAQTAATEPAPAVAAQDDAASQDQQEPGITVTGSRLLSSYNSPTPVNVIGEERMDNLNVTNVGEALNQLPAFRPLTTPSTNSFRASQNIAGRSLDLRGLGPTRTLTLIDGRRTVPSGDDGTFDLNSLPTILIQRSEVVTGGASAAYGADAVAGVVNLILDTRARSAMASANRATARVSTARSRPAPPSPAAAATSSSVRNMPGKAKSATSTAAIGAGAGIISSPTRSSTPIRRSATACPRRWRPAMSSI